MASSATALSERSISTLTAATPDLEISRSSSTERRLTRWAVDADAIAANYHVFQKLAPNAECAAVVKADAYGAGAHAAALALARAGARSFFTATTAEGLLARSALGPGPAIYVLNGIAP
ncbi:MAG: alanine racemase, partial [Caulobacterales bacterium]